MPAVVHEPSAFTFLTRAEQPAFAKASSVAPEEQLWVLQLHVVPHERPSVTEAAITVRESSFEGHATSPSWTMHVRAPEIALAFGKQSSPEPHLLFDVPTTPEHVVALVGASRRLATAAPQLVGAVPVRCGETETGKGNVAARSVQTPDATARFVGGPAHPTPDLVSTEPAHEPPEGEQSQSQLPPPDRWYAISVGQSEEQLPSPVNR